MQLRPFCRVSFHLCGLASQVIVAITRSRAHQPDAHVGRHNITPLLNSVAYWAHRACTLPCEGHCELAGAFIKCTACQRLIDEACMGDGNFVDLLQYWAHVRRSSHPKLRR